MAWRVKEQDVVDVIQVEDPESVVSDRIKRTLRRGIAAANALVDKVSSMDADGAALLNDALKTQIELYLAAHFAESFAANQQVSSESSLGASSTFQGQYGMKFMRTAFGQHALELDVSGILQEIQDGVQTVGVTWMGKPPSDQIDYVDRD